MRNCIHCILATILLASVPSWSQSGYGFLLPDTLWAKVIFYDFHADGTNPNFEAGVCGQKPNMIRDTLDHDRKPVLRANICFNDRISEWYRPSGSPGSTFYYDAGLKQWRWKDGDLVNYQSRPNEWVGKSYVPSYAMANVVLYDSLPFMLVDSATGTYEFIRSMNLATKQQFFWLDGKGFGTEPAGSGHNFSFTMEMHQEFTYKGGEFFNFRGDDDVWVFINGKLALDLGGIHAEASHPLDLDAIAGSFNLVKGRRYMFDFFYAERHTSQANCVITTNILTPTKPNSIIITPDTIPPDPQNPPPRNPDTTINAGQCVTWHAWVIDDTGGLRRDWDTLVHWEIVDTIGNGVVLDTVSDKNTLCLLKAHGCVKVYLWFSDPNFPGITLRDSIIICINPGAPHHLTIEGAPDLSGISRQDRPIGSITIPATISKDSVYAVIRDQYGNFVSASDSTEWSVVTLDAVITAAAGRKNLGEGVATKIGKPGTDSLRARSLRYTGANFTGAIAANVALTEYTQIRIAAGIGGMRTGIDTLVIKATRDTILYVEALRKDGLGWELIPATWSVTGVTAFTSPSGPVSSWTYRFMAAGHGRIAVTYGSFTKAIGVTVLPGGPATLDIYPDTGQPGAAYGNVKYSGIQTAAAGSTFPLVAKIFDPSGLWLADYQRDPLNARLFTWQARLKSGGAIDSLIGTLSTGSGPVRSFVPRKAGDTVDLIVSFSEGVVYLSDTVRIRIVAGTPNHLSIESSPGSQYPNRDNPLDQIELLASDTTQRVYAVMRDLFGNYIGPATGAQWRSVDTGTATVTGATDGQGIIRRISDTRAATWVYAQSTSFIDSLRVLISDITYTQLRIVVNAGGLRDIDTLSLKVLQDTTLFALGRRSDNGQWVNIQLTWSAAGLSLTPSAPANADRWQFSASATDTGKIYIRKGSAVDSVMVLVDFPPPDRLTLYPKPGTPDVAGNMPYPPATQVDTLTAGDTLAAVAKLFGADGSWLPPYESPAAPFRWNLRELSGSGSTGPLAAYAGFRTVFSPTRAFNTVEIAADFTNDAGVTLSDAIRLYIKAGAVTHLVLEATPNSPYENPLGSITIGSNDTVQFVYAVLRDRFGNLVRPDTGVEWISLDPAVVSAASGVSAIGEGEITRKANSGETKVIAINRANPSLRDTITVSLATISYTALRIVTAGEQQIQTLVMPTDKDTLLMVQGRRSDNGQWEYVSASWSLSAGITASPQPPASSSTFRFAPADTGSGWIIASLPGSRSTVPDTVMVMFTKGSPVSIALYPREGQPGGTNQPYPSPDTVISVLAGNSIFATVKLLDHRNRWLGDTTAIWTVEELTGTPPTGTLSATQGKTVSYTPRKARNTVFLVASTSISGKALRDTIYLSVAPGVPYQLVLEANQDWQLSPNTAVPIDSVTLSNIETYRSVYAMIRDSLGNFVAYSQLTDWISRDTALVQVSDGIRSVGQGIVEKIITEKKDTLSRIVAVSRQYPDLSDSVYVKILSIYFKELRIVMGNDTNGIHDLFMTTNDDTTLTVIGRRSDNDQWMQIKTKWETSSGLPVAPQAPEQASQWRFSPTAPATSGWIRVTLDIDSISRPDSVFVVFEKGAPVRVEFELLTPATQRIAGDTLTAVVRIRNKDGLVPGSYCTSSQYQDLLGSGGRDSLPKIFVDGVGDTLRQRSGQPEAMRECFADGIDTVKFVLYYAPLAKDSLHQFFVRINGIEANTVGFNLLPDTLAKMSIEYPGGKSAADTTLRAPNGYLYVYAVGYDRFGNKLGYLESNWSIISGNLHPLAGPAKIDHLYYSTQGVYFDEQGCIRAEVFGHTQITDSMCLTVLAPPAEITRAITRDLSGNGFLDHFELHFSKPITFDSAQLTIDIRGDNVFWVVDSIGPHSGRDTVFIVRVHEEYGTGGPQTAWTPAIAIEGIPEADSILSADCLDGAGPVIISVDKEIIDIYDRTRDIVTVVLSESYEGANGSQFSPLNPPDSVFNVWMVVNGDTVLMPHILDSINGFLTSRDLSVLKFSVQNGKDLTSSYYFSLRVDADSADTAHLSHNWYIIDKSAQANPPVARNQKVQLYVQPSKPVVIKSGPNPAAPNIGYRGFSMEYDANARWRTVTQGGTVISFPILFAPGETPDQVNGYAKIYDLAGNLVVHADANDLLMRVPGYFASEGGLHEYDIYWNCLNDRNMSVSPGVYRVVLKLDYVGSTMKDRIYTTTVGIKR